jgi:hypothetical protein
MLGIVLFGVGVSGCAGSMILCLGRGPTKRVDKLVNGSVYLLVAGILVACLGSALAEDAPSVSGFFSTVRSNLEDCESQFRGLF